MASHRASQLRADATELGFAAAPVAIFLIAFLARSSWGDPSRLPEPEGTVRGIGLALLTPDGWLVPFEYASILLLAALVGAVHLARRSAPKDDSP